MACRGTTHPCWCPQYKLHSKQMKTFKWLGFPTHFRLYLFFLSINLLSQETAHCFLFSCPNSTPSPTLFPIFTHNDFFLAQPINIQCISLANFEISTHPRAFGLHQSDWNAFHSPFDISQSEATISNCPIRSSLLFPIHFLSRLWCRWMSSCQTASWSIIFPFTSGSLIVTSFDEFLSSTVLVHPYNYLWPYECTVKLMNVL